MQNEGLLKVKQYVVSKDFFQKGFAAGNGPWKCTAQCCTSGVWVDVREHDAILEQKDLIKRQMDASQTLDESKWFEGEVKEDRDFPSGRCIGTAVINEKCAFLDSFGRCSIQTAALAAGKHKWAWKPMFCILFPVVVQNGVIEFDAMLQGKQMCCSARSVFDTPLFAACKEELIHILGNDGYAQLEEHYASLRKAHDMVDAS